MAKAVYILCSLTCAVCAILLFRGYHRSKARLLLWSALCFSGLTVNNILVFIDLVILPVEIDLFPLRGLVNLIALGLLIFGLVWDSA